jgi:hypothetical protein
MASPTAHTHPAHGIIRCHQESKTHAPNKHWRGSYVVTCREENDDPAELPRGADSARKRCPIPDRTLPVGCDKLNAGSWTDTVSFG